MIWFVAQTVKTTTSFPWATLVVPLVVALLGGGGVTAILLIKGNKHKLDAESKKLEAEADSIVSISWVKIVEQLKSDIIDLRVRIRELSDEHEQCRLDLATAREMIAKLQSKEKTSAAQADQSMRDIAEIRTALTKMEAERRQERSTMQQLLDQFGAGGK